MVTKAVFPVAGYGTRFLPATKAQPKEMLPIVDTPVIQYLVEEAVASGITDIIMVTGRGKRSIEDHFDYAYELEETLVEKGKHDLMGAVRAIAELARFAYVRQPKPLGDGHAILCAKEFVGNEAFAVLFGDDLVDSQEPALRQLIRVYEERGAPIIALQEVAQEEVSAYGVIGGQEVAPGIYKISQFVEKPSKEEAPSTLAIIGKYVLTKDVLTALEGAKAGRDGEIRLIDGLRSFVDAKGGIVYGVVVKGVRYDTGDKLGFLKATIDFALKRPDLAPRLKEYLRNLDFS